MQPKSLNVSVVSHGSHPNQLMDAVAFVTLGVRKCGFVLNSLIIPCRQILPAVKVSNLVGWTWKYPKTRVMALDAQMGISPAHGVLPCGDT